MEIQKIWLLYLQYILQQSDDSSINKFFKLQLEFPTRGDWASRVVKDIEELEIKESLEEIKLMSKNKFNQILKCRLRLNALKYLRNKQGTKGKDIQYSAIEMSEYLLPSNKNLTLEEKRRQFAIINKMVDMWTVPDAQYYVLFSIKHFLIIIVYPEKILYRNKNS